MGMRKAAGGCPDVIGLEGASDDGVKSRTAVMAIPAAA